MKSAVLSRVAQPGRARKAVPYSLPGPFGGWVTSESLLAPLPASAAVLDNWVPTRRGARQRGGTRTMATIPGPVTRLITFNAPNNRKLFAATATAIYDVSAVADPNVPPAAAVSGRTTGYYSFADFTTAGGQFLTAVNGTDPLLLYNPIDGWKPITDVSTPSITGAPTTALSFVWVYRNRQFFIRAGTLVAHYLPVGSVAGALGTIDLNGVFKRGGSLLFGASWGTSAGDGLTDRCVFVTDQGEVAVFAGSDPSTVNNWAIQGRYDITPPMGSRCTMNIGGDVVIGTEEGAIPLSEITTKDPSVLNIAAISKPIEPEWRREVVDRRSLPWEMVKFTRKGFSIVSLPVTSPGQEAVAFVVNTDTGKWSRFTNWDARCMILHADSLYIGTNAGKIKQCEIGGTDDNQPIYYTIIGNPEFFGDPASFKTVLQARATFVGSTPINPKISASMDFKVYLPAAPNAPDDVSSSAWDEGLWDVADWDQELPIPTIRRRWVSIGRSGYCMQYQVQLVGMLTPAPDAELVGIDIMYESGGVVV